MRRRHPIALEDQHRPTEHRDDQADERHPQGRQQDAAARAAPELRTVLNVGRLIPRGSVSTKRLTRLDAISVNVRALTRPVVAAARRTGLPLLVFACNTVTDVDRALAAGAAGVMSNRPRWLGSMLDRQRNAP